MSEVTVPSRLIDRAVRLSYVQAMLGSIYAASTGGMFIIGYALKLGANNVQIGLMSTVPMLCVVAQLFSAVLVERGISRRMMTIGAALANVSGWTLIVLLPYMAVRAPAGMKVGALIAIMALVTLFSHVSINARASWVGDLIPSDRWGGFFGRMIMFSGMIGAVFALLEGAFLDHVKNMGIAAFSWLFMFGMMFGLTNAMLFVPQADVTLEKHKSGSRFPRLVLGTFSNGALMAVMTYAALWSLQTIAGPFVATYMLRDLKMSFLGVGGVNSVATATILAASPFWGRVVDRYGCKPVLVACTFAAAPIPLIWMLIGSAHRAYLLLPPVNVLGGFASAGISVALSTLIYKVTPSVGRSVQLAVYSIMVVLIAAPMPSVGGHLTGWLRALGIGADLRVTFYACILFTLAAAFAARRIHEQDSHGAREMVDGVFISRAKERIALRG